MSRIYKIIGSELKFLFRTVILIGTILLFFVSALLSVISVLIDIPDGFYSGLDDMFPHKTLTVDGIDTMTAINRKGTPLYGSVDGITRYSVATAESSIDIIPSLSSASDDEDKTQQQASLALNAYIVLEGGIEYLREYRSFITGEVPDEVGEMAIGKDVADKIGAKIGDEVTFSPALDYVGENGEPNLSDVRPMKFKVTGFFDYGTLSGYRATRTYKCPIPVAYFYLVSDRSEFSSLCVEYDDAETVHSERNYFNKKGLAAVPFDPQIYEIIDTAVAFFAAVCAVLGLMVVFIIYALIAMFYRQRKGMICRLKLFGATDKQIGLIYCTITVSLILISALVGSALAQAFNLYFIGLCGKLFNTMSANFVSHFRPIVPGIVFGALALITILLFLSFERKIRRASIASEVRYE